MSCWFRKNTHGENMNYASGGGLSFKFVADFEYVLAKLTKEKSEETRETTTFTSNKMINKH